MAHPDPVNRDRDLALAIEHHMTGRYDEAERIYLDLHQYNRRDEEVLYLLGALCCDLGIFSQACRFIEEALTISPQFPLAQQQLVIALKGSAELDIASKRLDDAEISLRRALGLEPNDGKCLLGLGRIAMLRNHAVLAEPLLAQSLRYLENDADALNWHGLACLQLKKYKEADQSLRHVLAIHPDLHQARNNLGLSLYEQGRLEEARDCFMTAIACDPGYASAHVNLANTLRILGRAEDACIQLKQLVAVNPASSEALNNLGAALQDLGKHVEARECLERAAVCAPDSPHIRWNLALSQLTLGDYRQGWSNFEARWEGCLNLQGAYDKPPRLAWRGESLEGKRLLLWAEQGFGDTLQFIRFATELAHRGATVIVETQPELTDAIAGIPGVASVIARGETIPEYDLHCPLMSLPYRLEIDDIHSIVPTVYLRSDPIRDAYWKTKLAPYRNYRVGLAWAGKSRKQRAELAAIDARRSIALKQLTPVFQNRHCSFFSLQKGESASEIIETALPIHSFTDAWSDFSDTAAFIVNLDLVISVDTAVAHLAGALGKPVWLLNRYDTCWRWLLERTDSPWYSTLRQFRQPQAGNWEPVIAAIANELGTCAK